MYSAPCILKRHFSGHMIEGINEEASKGCHRGVGTGVGRVRGGPVDGEKERTCPRAVNFDIA